MALRKLNALGIAHYLVPMAVFVLVGVGGGAYLIKSHAETPAVVSLVDSSDATSTVSNGVGILGPQNTPSGTSNGPSDVPFNFIGTQIVSYVDSGDTLNYTDGFKASTTQCYEVAVEQQKSGTVTATVEFANSNNSVTKTLRSTTTNNLQQVCVKPGNKPSPGFNVYNKSPVSSNTTIEVLEDIVSS